MTAKDLEALFDYGYWANAKLFDVMSQLTPEQFTETVAGSYGSVRNTIVHMLSAEWGWLDRGGGAKRGPALNAADFPTLASVRDKWFEVEGHLREFLRNLRDEELGRVVEFALGNGPKQSMPLAALMQHAAVHGVHHRGQIALLLRMLGKVPGNVDILIYYDR